MTQYGFFFDSEACIGCKTCQMACKNKNNLPVGNLFRRVYEWEQVDDAAVRAGLVFISIASGSQSLQENWSGRREVFGREERSPDIISGADTMWHRTAVSR